MPSELTLAIQQLCEEKGLSIETIKETIEAALAAAYRKDFGSKLQNIKVEFDLEKGAFRVFDVKEVTTDELKEETEKLKAEMLEQKDKELVEELKSMGGEEVKYFNPKTMIALSEATLIKKDAAVGEAIKQELEVPADFGRMAAQTAKQVIIQKLREAERETIYNEFKNKQGELINGIIQRVEGKLVLIDMGNITAVMPITEQIRGEAYRPGVRLKLYVKSVEQGPKGAEVIVSRAHPEMVKKIFKLEVPEINSGAVQIKAVAREAGSRTKVAVFAKDDNIDPIGSCVGQRGTRVQTIINELGGEKIDIIEWHENAEKFITSALAPSKIIKVELKAENKEAKAYVKNDQYSLAIGKEGQNVRLAAKLVGWRIDIVAEGGATAKTDETATEKVAGEATAEAAANETLAPAEIKNTEPEANQIDETLAPSEEQK